MKKTLSIILSLVMVLAALPFAAVDSFALSSGDWEYSLNSSDEAVITGYTGSNTTIRIPSTLDGYTVGLIGENAFSGANIHEIYFPESIRSIGREAFKGSKLYEIILPYGLTTIGDSAFEDCKDLSCVSIPDTVKSLGYKAFGNCGTISQVYFGSGVHYIDDDLFMDSFVINMYVPESVMGIGSIFFHYHDWDSGLELTPSDATIYCYPDSDAETISASIGTNTVTFEGFKYRLNQSGTAEVYYDGIENCVEIPSEIDGYTVTAIDGLGFGDNKAIRKVTIPDTVTSIGVEAFYQCEALSRISIPDSVTSIGNNAFFGCSSLTGMIIPASVTSIGAYAFSSCNNLSTFYGYTGSYIESYCQQNGYSFAPCIDYIDYNDGTAEIEKCYGYETTPLFTVPSSIDGLTVTDFGPYAFDNRSLLEGIVLPDTLKDIHAYAFGNCTSLESIIIPDSVVTIGYEAFVNCTNLKNVDLGEGITEIAYEAFCNCSSLQTIIIPDSVTSLEGSAFSNCSELFYAKIGNSVEELANNLFYNCKSLEIVTIGKGITYINKEAFLRCDSLSCIYGYYGTCAETFASDNGLDFYPAGISYMVNGEGTVTLIYVDRDHASLKVPSEIDGYKVTAIGDYAFNDCTLLTDVTIPYCVTSISDHAFDGCTGLNVINGYAGTCAETFALGNGCDFHYLGIAYEVKNGTAEITAVTDPRSVVTVPSSIDGYTVTSIGKKAFYKNNTITQVILPATLTSIGNASFYGCSNLETVNIPDGVTKIGRSAFFACDSLGDLFIPASVTEIVADAFFGCGSMDTITGYLDTAAQDYAEAYDFNFVYLDVITKGDFNTDGSVDINDVGGIMFATANELKITNKQRLSGDLNDDGVVDAFDAAAVDRVVA